MGSRISLVRGGRAFEEEDLTLTYPGWEADKAEVENILRVTESCSEVAFDLAKTKLNTMKIKQRLFEGARSSVPELRTLDSTVFTYEGWQQDKERAERELTEENSFRFQCVFDSMKRKQAMHSDRSSLKLLRTLDSFAFSYPSWEADKAEVENILQGTENSSGMTLGRAKTKLNTMKIKQRLYQGRRSSVPELRKLDSTVFTYEGWQQDKERAERELTESDGSVLFKWVFDSMKRKQAMHSDRSSVEFLRALDSFAFSYPGWEADKAEVENKFLDASSPSWIALDFAKRKLNTMKNKQRLYQGDRSSIPELSALDNTVFTYEGWQQDKERAERKLTESDGSVLFECAFDSMKIKQAMHSDDRPSVFELRTLEKHYGQYRRARTWSKMPRVSGGRRFSDQNLLVIVDGKIYRVLDIITHDALRVAFSSRG